MPGRCLRYLRCFCVVGIASSDNFAGPLLGLDSYKGGSDSHESAWQSPDW